MDENEEFVQAHWNRVWRQDQKCMREAPNQWHGYILLDTGISEEMIASGTRKESWAAAATYTRDRLEEIRKAQLSALCLNHWGAISKGFPGQEEAWQYLTGLLNDELSRLQRGMLEEMDEL